MKTLPGEGSVGKFSGLTTLMTGCHLSSDHCICVCVNVFDFRCNTRALYDRLAEIEIGIGIEYMEYGNGSIQNN